MKSNRLLFIPGCCWREGGILQLCDEEQAAEAEEDDGAGEVDDAELVHRFRPQSQSLTGSGGQRSYLLYQILRILAQLHYYIKMLTCM